MCTQLKYLPCNKIVRRMCVLLAIENVDIHNCTLTLVPMYAFTAWIRKNFYFTISLGCTLSYYYLLHTGTHYFKIHFNIIVPLSVCVFPLVSYLQVFQVKFFRFLSALISVISININFRIHIFKLDTSYSFSCKGHGFVYIAM
jgi:hypothetical protein